MTRVKWITKLAIGIATCGVTLARSTAAVPEKATLPGAPVAKAGAMKLSAEPSSGAPAVGGGLPAARIAASPCTWLGDKWVKPTLVGVVG